MKERITSILFISFLLFSPVMLFAQALQVSGRVTAKSDGAPLPGVSVIIEGTKTGTSTDANGRFTITVPQVGAVLTFTQIGMQSEQYKVTGDNRPVNIVLTESTSALNEVVVVGYGTQKKSVVTGAISKVNGTELENQQISRVEQALQGRTSGLTIATSSGAPGSSATVRVRGITTLNNNDPLYVVDGVVIDVGGIDYLNSSDIESIEVLKDAASAAIYGARSANGVILVTTKKGKAGKLSINYNGYYGIQSSARRLDLLNATQYATLRNEASANSGGPIIFPDPQSLGVGTDWQDAIFNDQAPVQDHELSITGGNDKSTFYSSFGLFDQTGIVASDISKYKRYNIRLNSTHKITDWLTVGQTLGYSHIKSQGGLGTNTEFGGPLSSAINLDPTTPIIITDPSVANSAPYSTQAVVRDANGNPYAISTQVGQEMTNPLAYVQTRLGNYGWSDNFVGNAYVEIEPLKGLKLRSTAGGKMAWWGGENFTPIYYLSPTQLSSQTSFSRDRSQIFNWNLENTISYTKSIDKHNFTVLVGQGAYLDQNSSGLNIRFNDIAADNFDEATFNLKVPTANITADASDQVNHTVSSLFGRLTYNYNEKYLFTGIVRRDGSSKFGPSHKYGVFPSASVGWVATSEDFFPKNNVVNFLKVRASYGIVGNDNLGGDFRYLSTIGSGRNYVFGEDNLVIGYSPDAPANPDLKWEETSQLDLGFDANLFRDWSLTFDWFNKKTSGILRPITLPGYFGSTGTTYGNVADMENKGFEVELGYHKQIGDVKLGLSGNVSYIANKVTYLGNSLGADIQFINGAGGIQNMGQLQRTAIGHSYNAFYGYQIAGVFQNQAEIDSYKGGPDNTVIQPAAVPGDFKWADLNNDGKISDDDRTFLGNAIPDWSYGLNLNASWKAFDLQVFGQGVAGNKIFQGLRRLDIAHANWQTKALQRWTGEGTSNTYPRLATDDPNHNYSNTSDFYLEKGDYFRIKTLQIGYSIPKSVLNKTGLSRLRVYVSSNNLITFTKYTGFDPEIGGGADVFGIDAGIYPQARTISFGVNVGL